MLGPLGVGRGEGALQGLPDEARVGNASRLRARLQCRQQRRGTAQVDLLVLLLELKAHRLELRTVRALGLGYENRMIRWTATGFRLIDAFVAHGWASAAFGLVFCDLQELFQLRYVDPTPGRRVAGAIPGLGAQDDAIFCHAPVGTRLACREQLSAGGTARSFDFIFPGLG